MGCISASVANVGDIFGNYVGCISAASSNQYERYFWKLHAGCISAASSSQYGRYFWKAQVGGASAGPCLIESCDSFEKNDINLSKPCGAPYGLLQLRKSSSLLRG